MQLLTLHAPKNELHSTQWGTRIPAFLKNLKKYLSPEQLSGKLKRETKKILSHETIYKWIYKKRPKLQKYLRCQKGQWKRRRGSKKRAKQRRLQKFKCIETRPVEVETKEQEDFLLSLDCNLGQGYLFSKPLDFKSTIKFLKERKSFFKCY